MLEELRMFWRFATGLRRFLRTPLTLEQSHQIIREGIENREHSFLHLARQCIYPFPGSPYRKLLQWAGVEYGDLERMVLADGLESALDRLFEAGVRVSLAEVKGRSPIRRSGLHLAVTPEDFDNPLPGSDFASASGGSTGRRRRVKVSLESVIEESAARWIGYHAIGVDNSPVAIWRAVPPGSAGLKNCLHHVKIGNPAERWFTPTKNVWRGDLMKSAIFTTYAAVAGRRYGIPWPEYVPLDDPAPVLDWLQEKLAEGVTPLLSAPTSGAVRVCSAARRIGADLGGAVFLVGGEPLTASRYDVLRQVGADAHSGYAMSETGVMGVACGNREVVDEAHLLTGKIAFLQRSRTLADGRVAHPLYLTTLRTHTPKIMLNLESGDEGVLQRRRCGCSLETDGLDLHLHTIRSYEKLTAGGMHFLGADIVTLVDEILPKAFGGAPTDFQFVEVQGGDASRVDLVVSQRVGPLDEQAAVRTALHFLGSPSRGDRMMAEQWRQGGVLRVARREPFATAVGKIPPLLVRHGDAGEPPAGGSSGD